MNEQNSVPVARPVEPDARPVGPAPDASSTGLADLVDPPTACVDRETTDPAGGPGGPDDGGVHTPVSPGSADREEQPPAPLAALRPCAAPEHVKTDPLAVASAACGFMAIVPIVMQVIGLTLGVLSLIRIRRAKRNGLTLKGSRWATTGIVSSGFALICWVGIFAALSAVSSSISGATNSLDSLQKIGTTQQQAR